MRRQATGLDDRLVALGEAVDAGEGVAPEDDLRAARALIARAGARLGHGLEHTVVALAGATGSGKSSLFNALAGTTLSAVGVRRPTTGVTHACTWGEQAGALLDWLAVERRHHIGAGGEPRSCTAALDGLVLLDLPDHDSTTLAHRQEVDRVVGVADMVVWVLDPQKYADAAVHERYLRPLAGHAGVLLVVLNQADRLAADQLAACRADLARLLAEDGLGRVATLSTSARTGEGVDRLRAELAERASARRAAVDRLAADVGVVAMQLSSSCADGNGDRALSGNRRDHVVDALAGAAGVDTVVSAVARSHRARAAAATGWPATRWVRRLRPDPLRRLHLGAGSGSSARTSLPAPDAVQLSRVSTALRGAVDETTIGLPPAWGDALRAQAEQRRQGLAGRLDQALAATDLGVDRSPRWWGVAGAVQIVLAAVAVAGAVWLAALAGLAYLRVSDLGTPDVGRVPLPTAMLVGGVVAGLLVALVAGRLAAVGARRRARRARRRLQAAVDRVAEAELLAPLAALQERYRRFCAAVRRAR